ncbi:MAG: Lrp/AsnC family transcriptional regulator, partial [Candidatus Hodarchaeota archaeon]
GYHAKINASKLGEDIKIISSVRIRKTQVFQKIGKMLAEIPGVMGVYFVYGETSFIVMARSKNTQELFEKMNLIYTSDDIERATTSIVANTFKEDHRIIFDV